MLPFFFSRSSLFLTALLLLAGADSASPLAAQTLLPDTFLAHLETLKADIIRPLDTDFKAISLRKSRFPSPDFAMYSRREKLEIRYYLQSEKELGHFRGMPHVATGRFLMDIGSNDEDAQTAVHSFQGEQLATYRADWARLFTFNPKQSFAPYTYAQLVALYKEGHGLIWVILLFDRAPDTLDARQLAARFIGD